MNANELKTALKNISAKLENAGYNSNHSFSKCVSVQVERTYTVVDHLVKKLEKEFQLHFELDLNTQHECGTVTVFMNVSELKNKFQAEYEKSDEGGFTFNKATGFTASKTAELFNKQLNSKFSSSSFHTSGNWVGFAITSFGQYGHTTSVKS